jgi:hypothetical protein
VTWKRQSTRSRTASARPDLPVSVTIIEEAVATSKPFLRLKIRPTFPPHFDAEGRRQTRNNASTRPLTDEELLDLYLDREAAKFEQRFQQTADRVESHAGDIEFAFGTVRGQRHTWGTKRRGWNMPATTTAVKPPTAAETQKTNECASTIALALMRLGPVEAARAGSPNPRSR